MDKKSTICNNKSVYASPEAAEYAIAQISKKQDPNSKRKLPQSWYRCTICRGIHLTSKSNENQIQLAINPYLKQIEDLKAELKEKSFENHELRLKYNAHVKEARKELQETYKATWEKQIKDLQQLTKKLREDNYELITKLVKATEKLKEYEDRESE